MTAPVPGDPPPPAAPLPLEWPPPPRRRRRWPIVLGSVSYAMIALVVDALAFVGIHPGRAQWVEDQIAVLTQPPAGEAVLLANRTGMSDDGRLVFFASTPEVERTQSFVQHCHVEGGIVLGCYTGRDIYIYGVSDPRLAGTIEVTAAHEMLHAAYARLDEKERARVDLLVDEAVRRLPDDHRLHDQLAAYPSWQQPDEWHSRLGTEVADLPTTLEAYYARWFDDRSKVVELAERSTRVLREIEARIAELVAEADRLGAEIAALRATYEVLAAQLESDIALFNFRAATGGFSSPAVFQIERLALLERIAGLDELVADLNAKVARYNQVVDELTRLDAQYAELYQALDPANAPPDLD